MKSNKFAKIKIGDKNKKHKVAIVRARFNQEITDGLLNGALKALEDAGFQKNNIEIFTVPGSFEIPFQCLKLAKSKKYLGIISLGAIIKGETAHFDYVAKAVTEGILKVMLEEDILISFGVITTHNISQAKKRSKNNQNNKGYEAAMAFLEMNQNEF
jgi:6,7-dimethyl-8-ribityllumazine synthase